MSSPNSALRYVIGGALAVILTGACNGEKDATVSDSVAATTPAQSDSALADSAADMFELGVGNPKSTLPYELDTMLANNTLQAYIQDPSKVDFRKSLSSNDDSTIAGLHPTNPSTGCPIYAHVSTQSARGARHVKRANVGHGVVVARIRNLTNCATADYPKLEPRQTAYWIVVPDPSGPGLLSRFVTFTAEIASGTLDPCPGHGKRLKSRGAFRDNGCGTETLLASPPGITHNPRPWITCDAGCCSSANTLAGTAGKGKPIPRPE